MEPVHPDKECVIYEGCQVPKISVLKKYVTVCEGSNAYLMVVVERGKPPPRITWCFKDNTRGSCHFDINQRGITGQKMLISGARAEHSGWYQAFAENSLHSVSDYVHLTVLENC